MLEQSPSIDSDLHRLSKAVLHWLEQNFYKKLIQNPKFDRAHSLRSLSYAQGFMLFYSSSFYVMKWASSPECCGVDHNSKGFCARCHWICLELLSQAHFCLKQISGRTAQGAVWKRWGAWEKRIIYLRIIIIILKKVSEINAMISR